VEESYSDAVTSSQTRLAEMRQNAHEAELRQRELTAEVLSLCMHACMHTCMYVYMYMWPWQDTNARGPLVFRPHWPLVFRPLVFRPHLFNIHTYIH